MISKMILTLTQKHRNCTSTKILNMLPVEIRITIKIVVRVWIVESFSEIMFVVESS